MAQVLRYATAQSILSINWNEAILKEQEIALNAITLLNRFINKI